MIVIRVPAVPVAQPRQRHRIASVGGKSFVKNYTPTKAPVNDFKATVRHTAAEAYQGPPATGALFVTLTFVMPRPKGMFWKKKPMPRAYHTARPDCDNLAKSVLDCLKGLVWLDDAQISHLKVVKEIAGGDEQPHVVIHVSELSPEPTDDDNN